MIVMMVLIPVLMVIMIMAGLIVMIMMAGLNACDDDYGRVD